MDDEENMETEQAGNDGALAQQSIGNEVAPAYSGPYSDPDWAARNDRANAIGTVAGLFHGIGISAEKLVDYARVVENYIKTGE